MVRRGVGGRKSANPPATGARRATLFGVLSVAAAIVFIAGLFAFMAGYDAMRIALRDPELTSPLRFIGSADCVDCHKQEAAAWRGSHHAKAMAHASGSSVLGDFNDAVFEYFGIRSRMFRRGDRFLIETDGPDGKLDVFEVKYTFGLEPLQQYLVEFADGRVQALAIAWDSRPENKGGQRWFHLYPDERINFQHDLHWTRSSQNWNFMCAECHSTGVRKNYDPANNSFQTTFAEISVGCEACHGQGSRHAAWARSQSGWRSLARDHDPAFGLAVRYAERLNATWPVSPVSGNAQRSAPPPRHRTEVESCGRCHARRGPLTENWSPGRPLSETHSVSLLSRGLYDAAGQMEDEVFNYGSFRQSKMFAEGVTCSNCHEPHSGKLRIAGDGVCLQCHAGEKFSVAAHHRHDTGSSPPTCADCHMPVRTYMVVDKRHDHGFSIPRPDRSARYGVRNACNDCHTDKSAEWAANALAHWYGPDRKGFQTYAPAFAAARAGAADAARLLAAVAGDRATPAIARATALAELAAYPSPTSLAAAREGLANPDPLVRIAALDALEPFPVQQAIPHAARALEDPVRGVRIRAASLLASASPHWLSPRERQALDRAATEFIAAQTLSADRPEARLALGGFYQQRGQFTDAEAQYRGAIRLEVRFAPAYINLADLYRRIGREGDSLAVLREGIAVSPDDASLRHAQGLALVRVKAAPSDVLRELARAVELAPDEIRFAYAYGVALHSFGMKDQARAVLRSLAERSPNDGAVLQALAAYEQESGDFVGALRYIERLMTIRPDDASLRKMQEELRRMASPH